jgi:hypothetical protein
MYQEELDQDPFLWDDDDDDDEEVEAEEGVEADVVFGEVEEDEDEDDDLVAGVMRPEHFYHFKTYFTQAEAVKLIEGVKEKGEMTKVPQLESELRPAAPSTHMRS